MRARFAIVLGFLTLIAGANWFVEYSVAHPPIVVAVALVGIIAFVKYAPSMTEIPRDDRASRRNHPTGPWR